jgi:hypothetical protein
MKTILVKSLVFGKNFDNEIIIELEQLYLGFDFRSKSEQDDPIKVLSGIGDIIMIYNAEFKVVE